VAPPAAPPKPEELLSAAQRGDVTAVQALLAKGADVNAMANNGRTALIEASQNGHLDVVQVLLAKGADVNAKDSLGFSALQMASGQKGHLDVVQVLLAKGADVNAQDNEGWTALMGASASSYADLDIVQALLAKGADVNAKKNDGATALMEACAYNDDGLTPALRRTRALMVERTAYRYLPIVQALLANGADVNARANDGRTALIEASQRGHRVVVQALLAKGADVNAKGKGLILTVFDQMPFHDTPFDDPLFDDTALGMASREGHLDVVLALLAKGADVNAKASNGLTALVQASLHDHLAVVQALLANGADVNAKANNGVTALHEASAAACYAVAAVLVKAGAKGVMPASVYAQLPSQGHSEEIAKKVATDALQCVLIMRELGVGANDRVISADGKAARCLVGNTDIELVTDVVGVEDGYLFVSTKKFGKLKATASLMGNISFFLTPKQTAEFIKLLKVH
jgi:hypothetical protein